MPTMLTLKNLWNGSFVWRRAHMKPFSKIRSLLNLPCWTSAELTCEIFWNSWLDWLRVHV